MNTRKGWAAVILAAALSACGGSGSHHAPRHARGVAPTGGAAGATTVAALRPPAPPARQLTAAPPVQALVTAETENRLLVVDLPSGRVVRRIAVPADPEDLATDGTGGVIVVVSSAAGKVTLLSASSFHTLGVLGGFKSPHIAAIAPDDQHAYVTDDAGGTVTAIDLANLRVTSTTEVGVGAHHLGFAPYQSQAWVALGESARAIVMLSTQDYDHPRVIGRFDPGFPVHDVEFPPDAQQAWVTSSDGPDASVFNPANRKLLFRVPVGSPPQHVAFAGRNAYLTSGSAGTIEQVDAATGRILARAKSPYGSFELAAGDGYVVTSSLLLGTLAIYTSRLRLLRVVHLAPAAREVAISNPG
jgi:DNA-binding beta-propeller fold protein YncE